MGFIVGVVAALLVIFLLAFITLKKPIFGRILIAISLVLILLSTYFYFQKDQRVEKRQQLISIDEIVITDVAFAYAYGSYFKVTGNISNRSEKYRLQAVNLKLIFFKCPEQHSQWQDCEHIDSKEHVIRSRLAARQSAPFETYLVLDKETYLPLRLKIEVNSGVAR